jgi:hypothetical protein
LELPKHSPSVELHLGEFWEVSQNLNFVGMCLNCNFECLP